MVLLTLSFLNCYSKHSIALETEGRNYFEAKFSRSRADNVVKIKMNITQKYGIPYSVAYV